MTNKTLQDRLDNWGRVMRVSKGKPVFCAPWAREYYRLRDKQHQALAAQLNLTYSAQAGCEVDLMDAMLIERAVCMLATFEQKQVLKMRYVMNYSDAWIKSRLRVRNRDVCMMFARTFADLNFFLARFEKMDTIRPHDNLHAGVDSAPIVRCSAALGAAIA